MHGLVCVLMPNVSVGILIVGVWMCVSTERWGYNDKNMLNNTTSLCVCVY